MSALFGYSGKECRKLSQTMARSLSHRGGKAAFRTSGPFQLGSLDPVTNSSAEHVTILAAGTLQNPPENLAAHYLENGIEGLSSLRGSFVLAIQDGDALHLLRDGAGRRTAYYGHHETRHLFAIEPKGIYQVSGFERRLRPAAVAQYLTFSFIPGAPTMLEDIFEVPAGCYVTLREHTAPAIHPWFRPEDSGTETKSDEEWIERFQSIHHSAVNELLDRGRNQAIFLSGGLDSSVVTAEVAKQSSHPVHTYSVHFGEDLPNELEYARMVASHCNTKHEEVLIQPKDFLPRLPKLIWHLDEPIGDPVAMPNFELARHVSEQGFDSVFNGEGGDPLFGGPKNIPMLIGHWYGDTGFRRETAYLKSYRRCYEELDYLFTPDFRRLINKERDLESLLTPYFSAQKPAAFINKLTSINYRLKGAHLILPKVERMLGSVGMNPKSPLFDERLLQLTFQLPGHLKMKHGIEKIIIKRAYEAAIPPEIIARPKSGMRVPVHFWFRKELSRYARKLLRPKTIKAAGIFDEKRIQQILKYETDEGRGRYGIRLWMLITFELWRRTVLEKERF